MQWQRVGILAVLVATWAAFAGWQHQSYVRARELIRETVHQQAHSVMNALVGGIRSHRRLGPFFEVQLQGMLDGLVQAEDVRAVAVYAEDGQTRLQAGDAKLLPVALQSQPGDYWDDDGFRLVEGFVVLVPDLEADPSYTGRSGQGQGSGAGLGLGRGYGRRRTGEIVEDEGPFAEGGRLTATLMIDRLRHDQLVARAARSHMLVAGAAGLVLFCVALAWRASVRMVAAQGKARVLEAEARHLRELSQAAAGLAHETRNPLGLVRGWTQRLIQGRWDPEEARDRGQSVLEECDRVTARINQFLAFARPTPPKLTAVATCPLCAELAVILQPDLETKELQLVCETADDAEPLQADPELLRQAIFNLVQNAIQFAPRGDRVTLALTTTANGDHSIEVRDRGPGVAEQDVPSLFTPYFTTRPDGTGLGLAIVRRIAAAHGWEVTYRPRPGGGSVFALEGIHG